jgi:hypothetical protein
LQHFGCVRRRALPTAVRAECAHERSRARAAALLLLLLRQG